MSQVVLQTEVQDIVLDDVVRDGCYVFCSANCPEVHLLYRVLLDDEMLDRASDAVLKYDGCVDRLVLVSAGFQTSEAAFACMQYNKNRVEQMLGVLEEIEEPILNQDADDAVPKILCYDYLFNYFGGQKYDDKQIVGASVSVAFRPYVKDELVTFVTEPKCVIQHDSRISDKPVVMDFWLSDMVDISFDKKKMVKMTIDKQVRDIFKLQFGWDKIDVELVNYSLDYMESLYTAAPMEVSKQSWEKFLRANTEYFDIADNRHAQCPSYSWLDV